MTEAATVGDLLKKDVLKNFKKIHADFNINLTSEFCKNFKENLFTEHLCATAFDTNSFIPEHLRISLQTISWKLL